MSLRCAIEEIVANGYVPSSDWATDLAAKATLVELDKDVEIATVKKDGQEYRLTVRQSDFREVSENTS